MKLSKEKFVETIKEMRKMLKTEECPECSCPNIRCELHGDCYNCIRIYRHFAYHIPRCLQFVLDKKVARITQAADELDYCLACLNWCPEKAIQNGGDSQKSRRYHHPDISIKEIITGR